ncbi:hypothetical protein DPMN_121395 [Dreissena polymorpha]|uniref:Uncharacterized protein n=1 Tax=Dreissena polymorpha TaxID=45954 RepID=A0A9D4GM05_DREPO|nr:hypothetical protein DPMN_121395 [Dreissena polymorpha]
MKKCVESGPITPMQKEWAQKIVQMIPPALRSTPYLRECVDELFEEIRTDFTASMKKSMGMFKLCSGKTGLNACAYSDVPD